MKPSKSQGKYPRNAPDVIHRWAPAPNVLTASTKCQQNRWNKDASYPMKRCIIVHGWEGFPEEGWFPWLKQQLEAHGFSVDVPAMPHADKPQMTEWVQHLSGTIGNPNADTFLVGHSLGCITILRYLESLSENQTIGGALLVAGFAERLKYDELANFFTTPVNWDKVKNHGEKFSAIFSTSDPYVPLSNADLFKAKLNANITTLPGPGHFSGPEDNCFELPEALEVILKLAN